MKLYILLVIILIIFNSTYSLDIPNFDVREKFLSCYNEAYSSNYNDIVCYTNFSIQLSMILTDKLCNKTGSKRLLSSQNMNTCMQLDGKVNDCRELASMFVDYQTTITTIKSAIAFVNNKGLQYADEKLYEVKRDSEEKPGYFPPCEEYTPSVQFKINENIEILTEEKNFDEIQKYIYENGPILAMIDTDRNDILNLDHAIYFPTPITPLKHDGYKFFRVVGWRTRYDKVYWVFNYTLDNTWGLSNYKLIPANDYNLTFLKIELK